MQRIAAAVLAVLASFAAAAGQVYAPHEQRAPNVSDAETGDYSALKRVAIVSALGPQFHIGLPEQQRTLDVSGWKLDALVEATLRRYLAGRFEIVETNIDRAGLPAAEDRDSRTIAFLKSQPVAGVDGYVVVRPKDDELPGPPGIGMHLGAMCANYEIAIVDARHWAIVGRAVSRIRNQAPAPANFACYAADASYVRAFPEAKERARARFNRLVPRSIVETLRALELGLALPPPGDHSIAPPEDAVNTEGIASVAVVSAFADSFSFSTPHGVLRDQELVEIPIAWGLDEEAERIAGAALATKFAVRPANVDRAALARVVLRERGRLKIEGLQPSADVDAYVVIVKAFREGTASAGPGLWNQDWMGRSTWVYANYAVVLVDARSLKIIRALLPVMGPHAAVPFPLMRVDGALWPDGDKTAAAAENARGIVRELIADSILETLYQLGLTKD